MKVVRYVTFQLTSRKLFIVFISYELLVENLFACDFGRYSLDFIWPYLRSQKQKIQNKLFVLYGC